MTKVTKQFALLGDGSVIRLTKDCNCCNHDGPHFLYMDAYWKSNNAVYAEEGRKKGSGLIIESAAKEEVRRLQEKSRFFKDRGIVRLLTPNEVPANLRNSTGMKGTIKRFLFTESYDGMVSRLRYGMIKESTFRAYCAVWTWVNYRFSGTAERKQLAYHEKHGLPALTERINKVRKSFGLAAI